MIYYLGLSNFVLCTTTQSLIIPCMCRLIWQYTLLRLWLKPRLFYYHILTMQFLVKMYSRSQKTHSLIEMDGKVYTNFWQVPVFHMVSFSLTVDSLLSALCLHALEDLSTTLRQTQTHIKKRRERQKTACKTINYSKPQSDLIQCK